VLNAGKIFIQEEGKMAEFVVRSAQDGDVKAVRFMHTNALIEEGKLWKERTSRNNSNNDSSRVETNFLFLHNVLPFSFFLNFPFIYFRFIRHFY
jgi:hypothetical protein